VSLRVDVNGSLAISPPTGQPLSSPAGTLAVRTTAYMPFQQGGSWRSEAGDNAIDLGPITNVRALLFRADTPCVLKLTSGAGTDKAIPLDGLVQLLCQNSPVTGITITGASSGTYSIAGD